MIRDGGHDLPGLPSLDGLMIIAGLGVEEDEVVWVDGNIWVSSKVFCQHLSDAVIHDYLLPFSSLLFPNPELATRSLLCIKEVVHPQLQQVRNPQRGVNSNGEQEQIAKALLAAQQVLYLSDLSAVADGFDEVHKMGRHNRLLAGICLLETPYQIEGMKTRTDLSALFSTR
jgi:hypothetical protein